MAEYQLPDEIKETIMDILQTNSPQTINMNIGTWLESEEMDLVPGKNKKIRFGHSLFNKEIGFTDRVIHANPDGVMCVAQNLPAEFLYLSKFEPIKYFPEIRRNGGFNDKNVKKNKFNIGTIVNAQTMQILNENEIIKELPVYASLMTDSGQGFYKSIGINPDDLMFKGVSFKEVHNKSLEAAIKAGYKF